MWAYEITACARDAVNSNGRQRTQRANMAGESRMDTFGKYCILT